MLRVLRSFGLVALLTCGGLHAVHSTNAQTALPRVTFPEDRPVEASRHPIIGTWRWDNDLEHPNTHISYGVFHADGTYEEVTTGAGTAVGEWQETGDRSVAVTYVFQDIADEPAVLEPGATTIWLTADVRPSGNVVVAEYSYDARTLDGAVLDQGGPYQAQGSRVMVDPLAINATSVGGGSATHDDAESAAKIVSAISAAPPAISDEAMILDNAVDEDGQFLVVREGSNGWFCFPDLPTSPGNDPQCMDQTWLDWNYAYLAGEEPTVTVPGIEYMLQGGSDASNTDPFATEPAPGDAWVSSPPHIMLLMPGELDPSVFSTDHQSGHPYIMWAGTPYEHIMVPVTAMESMR